MKIRNLTAKYSSHKGGRHTSAKDYNRQQLKQETKQMSEESKEPDFSVSQSWQDLSKWEKANDVIVYGYLDAQEILEHFEGEDLSSNSFENKVYSSKACFLEMGKTYINLVLSF